MITNMGGFDNLSTTEFSADTLRKGIETLIDYRRKLDDPEFRRERARVEMEARKANYGFLELIYGNAVKAGKK